jgi:hypothetical protein
LTFVEGSSSAVFLRPSQDVVQRWIDNRINRLTTGTASMIAALRRLFSVSPSSTLSLSHGTSRTTPAARRRAPHRKPRTGGYAARFRPSRRPPHVPVVVSPISLTA